MSFASIRWEVNSLLINPHPTRSISPSSFTTRSLPTLFWLNWIILCLRFSDWFANRQNSIWFQINWKTVYHIPLKTTRIKKPFLSEIHFYSRSSGLQPPALSELSMGASPELFTWKIKSGGNGPGGRCPGVSCRGVSYPTGSYPGGICTGRSFGSWKVP